MKHIEKIESCGFVCQAGPLELCTDWIHLKELVDLYVIRRRGGTLVCHTQGKGGWGFSCFTNEAEAQAVATAWNEDKYGGAVLCTVHPLLSLTTKDRTPPGQTS